MNTERIDNMIVQVSRIAARSAIAVEKGMPINRIMTIITKGTDGEVARKIMDVVIEAKKEFDATEQKK